VKFISNVITSILRLQQDAGSLALALALVLELLRLRSHLPHHVTQ
jgi:hypothetical protein